MTDDLLARIDLVTEEWDSWDGDSADAMRWAPDMPERAVVRVAWDGDYGLVVATWQAAGVAYMRVMRELAAAVVPIVEALTPAVRAAAAAVEEAGQRARPKHVPPFWAGVPTKQRRRR